MDWVQNAYEVQYRKSEESVQKSDDLMVANSLLSRAAMQVKNGTFWVSVLAAVYLAVLPMAGTIALRNLALFALLVLLLWHFYRQKPMIDGAPIRSVVPILIWAVYLCVFPLLAEPHVEAWRNLWTIWFRGLMALTVGAGVALILFGDRQRGTVLQLGLITTLPILIHLGLVGWRILETSAIPWNYWGRETHHADLGYAAGHAIIFLSVALLTGGVTRPIGVVALMAASILSVVVAQSRGGVGFAFVGLLLVLAAFFFASGGGRRGRLLLGLLGVIVFSIAALGFAAKNDARWLRMADRLSAGFHGDALQIECEGTRQVETELVAKYGAGGRTSDLISSIQNGDGARTVLLRAGMVLALDHPWGLDGSRQAFNKRLKEYCPNPAIQMAHTHNGWLDTALALGWIGAALYAWVLINFLRLGLASLKRGGAVSEWALVLVSISAFWILRGFADSVYRDHQLEMQGFVLAYAGMSLWLSKRASPIQEASCERVV